MKIGLIQGTSQKEKNKILEHYIKQAISPDDKLINFGIYQDSTTTLSYVQISLAIALLINSRALDFVVTGCSSGQGMMLHAIHFQIFNAATSLLHKTPIYLAILMTVMLFLFL